MLARGLNQSMECNPCLSCCLKKVPILKGADVQAGGGEYSCCCVYELSIHVQIVPQESDLGTVRNTLEEELGGIGNHILAMEFGVVAF